MDNIIPTGQGVAKLADAAATSLDDHGMTNPNLHRHVDAKTPSPESGEVAPRKYQFAIQNVNSYRTTRIITHDEESETDEVP